MLRSIITFLFICFGSSALAQQSTSQSTLSCVRLPGLATVLNNMIEPTQIGALGNPPSGDVLRGQNDCEYMDYVPVASDQRHIGWIQTDKWLVQLMIIRGVLNYRPGVVLRTSQWQLPRRCMRGSNVQIIQGVKVVGSVHTHQYKGLASGCGNPRRKY